MPSSMHAIMHGFTPARLVEERIVARSLRRATLAAQTNKNLSIHPPKLGAILALLG